jgi:hypothetical protein
MESRTHRDSLRMMNNHGEKYDASWSDVQDPGGFSSKQFERYPETVHDATFTKMNMESSPTKFNRYRKPTEYLEMANLRFSQLDSVGLPHINLVARNSLHGHHSRSSRFYRATMRRSTPLQNYKLPFALLLLATLIDTVSAVDDPVLQPQSETDPTRPLPYLQHSICLLETCTLVVVGLVTSTTQNVLGPLMGCPSVLWFIMRNDSAIKPGVSWT